MEEVFIDEDDLAFRYRLKGDFKLLHREDGPAVVYKNGSYKAWYLYGKLHRIDGPAIVWGDGTKSWYVKGKHINCSSQQEFEQLIRMKAFW